MRNRVLYYTSKMASALSTSFFLLCALFPRKEKSEKLQWTHSRKAWKDCLFSERGLREVLLRSSQTFFTDRRSHGQRPAILRKGDICFLRNTKFQGPKRRDTKSFFLESQPRAVAKIILSYFFLTECRAYSSILITVFTVFSFSLFRNGTQLSWRQPFLYLIGSTLKTKYWAVLRS